MAPARAALLVYHDSAAEGTQSPTGWAYAAARTARRLDGVLDTVLVTNRAKEPALAAGPFARVVQLDVLCRGGSGEYFQYFAQLPQGAGESVVYNTQGDPTRLVESLRAMCDMRVCERAQARPGVMKTPEMPRPGGAQSWR